MAKKHGVTDIKHADAHQDEELHVTRTTPQGTQEAGVDKGHEKRDIKIRVLILWFSGLTIGTIITIGAMIFMLRVMTWQDMQAKMKTASPLYGQNMKKRTPELFPNPQQLTNGEGYTQPWEHYHAFVKDQDKALGSVSLEDNAGRPALPRSVVSEVEREPSSGIAYQDEERPSEATGGTGKDIAILTK